MCSLLEQANAQKAIPMTVLDLFDLPLLLILLLLSFALAMLAMGHGVKWVLAFGRCFCFSGNVYGNQLWCNILVSGGFILFFIIEKNSNGTYFPFLQ
jgi:hypothetical protein